MPDSSGASISRMFGGLSGGNKLSVINQTAEIPKIDASIIHPSLASPSEYLVFFAFRVALLPLQYLLEFVVLVPEAPYLSTQLLVLPAQLLDVVLTCNRSGGLLENPGNADRVPIRFSRGNRLITGSVATDGPRPAHLSKRSIIGQAWQQSLTLRLSLRQGAGDKSPGARPSNYLAGRYE